MKKLLEQNIFEIPLVVQERLQQTLEQTRINWISKTPLWGPNKVPLNFLAETEIEEIVSTLGDIDLFWDYLYNDKDWRILRFLIPVSLLDIQDIPEVSKSLSYLAIDSRTENGAVVRVNINLELDEDEESHVEFEPVADSWEGFVSGCSFEADPLLPKKGNINKKGFLLHYKGNLYTADNLPSNLDDFFPMTNFDFNLAEEARKLEALEASIKHPEHSFVQGDLKVNKTTGNSNGVIIYNGNLNVTGNFDISGADVVVLGDLRVNGIIESDPMVRFRGLFVSGDLICNGICCPATIIIGGKCAAYDVICIGPNSKGSNLYAKDDIYTELFVDFLADLLVDDGFKKILNAKYTFSYEELNEKHCLGLKKILEPDAFVEFGSAEKRIEQIFKQLREGKEIFSRK